MHITTQKLIFLEKFQTLSCITSTDSLVNYIDYCLEHHSDTYDKSVHSIHHVLPQAKTLPFKEYRSLRQHPWNRVVLTHYHHYRAHYLLAVAVDHLSTYTAFCGMHNKDFALNRLSIDDLIPEEEFTDLYTRRNSHLSNYWNEMVEQNGEIVSRATIRGRRYSISLSDDARRKHSERMSGDRNIVYRPGVVDKIRRTKIENSLDKISADRAADTMKRTFTDEFGNETTRYEQNGKKLSVTLNTVFMNKDGSETTLAKEFGRARSEKMIRLGTWYHVKSVFDEKLCMILPCNFVRKISPALDKKTKEDYLGKSKFGQTAFRESGREYLIGLYAEKLPKAPEYYTLDQDYSPYLRTFSEAQD